MQEFVGMETFVREVFIVEQPKKSGRTTIPEGPEDAALGLYWFLSIGRSR